MASLLRILSLLALVMMPFTMTAASAKSHAMPAAMAEGHCSEQLGETVPLAVDLTQCMLMCTALPAAETLGVSSPEAPIAPRQVAVASPIHGIILDIATPPPRHA